MFDFVLKFAEGNMLEDTGIDMLTNINRSLRVIWRDEIGKARKESAAKTKAAMRDNYLWAIEAAEKVDNLAAARKAEREIVDRGA